MSRPFSYNDKDLTVIGNMLFIHIRYPYLIFPGKIFKQIPHQIKKGR